MAVIARFGPCQAGSWELNPAFPCCSRLGPPAAVFACGLAERWLEAEQSVLKPGSHCYNTDSNIPFSFSSPFSSALCGWNSNLFTLKSWFPFCVFSRHIAELQQGLHIHPSWPQVRPTDDCPVLCLAVVLHPGAIHWQPWSPRMRTHRCGPRLRSMSRALPRWGLPLPGWALRADFWLSTVGWHFHLRKGKLRNSHGVRILQNTCGKEWGLTLLDELWKSVHSFSRIYILQALCEDPA